VFVKVAALKIKGLHVVFASRGQPLGRYTFYTMNIMCKRLDVIPIFY